MKRKFRFDDKDEPFRGIVKADQSVLEKTASEYVKRGIEQSEAELKSVDDMIAMRQRELSKFTKAVVDAYTAENPLAIPAKSEAIAEEQAVEEKASDYVLNDDKPFKTKDGALAYAKENNVKGYHPKKYQGGYALVPNTRSPKQLANDAKLGKPRPVDDLNDDLISAIKKSGGLKLSEKKENRIDDKDLVRYPFIFMDKRSALSLDGMAESLSQYGYPVMDEEGNYSGDVLFESLMEAIKTDRKIYTPQGMQEQLAKGEEARAKHEAKLKLENQFTEEELDWAYSNLSDDEQQQAAEIASNMSEQYGGGIPLSESESFALIGAENENVPSAENSGETSGTAAQSADGRQETPGNQSQASAFGLSGQTDAEIKADQAALDQAAKDKADADKKQAEADAKESERKTVQSRMDGANADFQLGQSAEDNLSGQGDVFSRPAANERPGNKIALESRSKSAERLNDTGRAGVWGLPSTLPNGANHVAVKIAEAGKRFFYGDSRTDAERAARAADEGIDLRERSEGVLRETDRRPVYSRGSFEAYRKHAQSPLDVNQAKTRRNSGGLNDKRDAQGACFQYSADLAADGLGDMLIGQRGWKGGDDWHAVVRLQDGSVYEPTSNTSFQPGVYERLGFKVAETLTPDEVRQFMADHSPALPFPSPSNLGLAPREDGRKDATESRSDASERRATGVGMPQKALQSHVDKISAKWNGPAIQVIAREDAPFSTSFDAQGALHNGTVYLFHDNIPNKYVGEMTLLHEVLGHYGFRGALKGRLVPVMNMIYRGNEWIAKAADTWAADEINQAKRGSMSDAEWKALATEEAMSDVAASETLQSRLPELNGWDKLVAAVRNFLRSIGFVHTMSDKDIVSLLASSRNFVERGGSQYNGKLSPALSRAGKQEPVAAESRTGQSSIFDTLKSDGIRKAITDEAANVFTSQRRCNLFRIRGQRELF